MNENGKTSEKPKKPKEPSEFSKSGAPVYRYTEDPGEFQSPEAEGSLEEISKHIGTHIGPVENVFHELISDTVHIDIHHVKATAEKPYHTLITSGMSDMPMNTPPEYDATKYLELMVTLPEDWPMDQEQLEKEEWYWPIRQLKFLARFPHQYNTWLGWGHTIPNGDPPEPFASNIKLSGIILFPPLMVPEEFHELKIDEEKTIHFFSLVPLYEEEMKLKLKKGAERLMDNLDKFDIGDIVDPIRKNTAKKRFGIFGAS